MARSTPLAMHSTSCTALSVSTSSITWPRLTGWPTATIQRAMPSSAPALVARSGIFILTFIDHREWMLAHEVLGFVGRKDGVGSPGCTRHRGTHRTGVAQRLWHAPALENAADDTRGERIARSRRINDRHLISPAAPPSTLTARHCAQATTRNDDGMGASAFQCAQLIERVGEAGKRARLILIRHEHVDQRQQLRQCRHAA